MVETTAVKRVAYVGSVVDRGTTFGMLDFVRHRLEWPEGTQPIATPPVSVAAQAPDFVDTENLVG